MKTDTYTKTVLTIIAVCLLFIAGKQVDLFPKAYGAGEGGFANIPLNEDGTVNVRIVEAPTMDVNITSCDANAFYRAEPIKVETSN